MTAIDRIQGWGLGWLEQQRAAHLASPATYRREGLADATVAVTLGTSRYDQADAAGASMGAHATDVLVAAAELAAAGFGVPQPGDRVILASGVEYEALPVAGQPCWRWSDTAKTRLRIHVKDVTEPGS
jgi:hypothetical protein